MFRMAYKELFKLDIIEKLWLDNRIQHTFGLVWLPDRFLVDYVRVYDAIDRK